MNTAIYIHIPFCCQRCRYCDFNTYSGLLPLRPAYVDALHRDIAWHARAYPDVQATTLYFGGGTPSLLPAASVRDLIHDVQRAFALSPDAEITLEANPGTVDAETLAALREAGVNRLSLGVQSAFDDELWMLGRIHTWDQAVQAIALARQAGFDNLSIDLIFGLPNQTLARWESTLARALALEPEHLSLYALTVEPGTPLAADIDAGALPSPDPDMAADMYDIAAGQLHGAGFWQYEISNWARGTLPADTVWALPPDGETENIGPWIGHHNLVYWRNESWLGIGAGAHSWFGQQRWSRTLHPAHYVREAQQAHWSQVDIETITPALERGETMMMGLRLAEGVSEQRFRERFGSGIAESYPATLARLSDAGLLACDSTRIRLTTRGRLLGNQVFGAFLPEKDG